MRDVDLARKGGEGEGRWWGNRFLGGKGGVYCCGSGGFVPTEEWLSGRVLLLLKIQAISPLILTTLF